MLRPILKPYRKILVLLPYYFDTPSFSKASALSSVCCNKSNMSSPTSKFPFVSIRFLRANLDQLSNVRAAAQSSHPMLQRQSHMFTQATREGLGQSNEDLSIIAIIFRGAGFNVLS